MFGTSDVAFTMCYPHEGERCTIGKKRESRLNILSYKLYTFLAINFSLVLLVLHYQDGLLHHTSRQSLGAVVPGCSRPNLRDGGVAEGGWCLSLAGVEFVVRIVSAV